MAGKNSVLLSSIFNENIFMKGFLANLYLRPSCYKCKAKNGAANSDITIADFWGIQKSHPEFDDDKGVSVIFIHSDKGESILNKLSTSVDYIETSFAEATFSNPSYLHGVNIPAKYSHFWNTFEDTNSVHFAVISATRITLLNKIKSRIRKYYKKFVD